MRVNLVDEMERRTKGDEFKYKSEYMKKHEAVKRANLTAFLQMDSQLTKLIGDLSKFEDEAPSASLKSESVAST